MQDRRRKRDEREAQVKYAERVIARRSTSGRPPIRSARLSPDAIFGALGSPEYVTGHHTAGPIDKDTDDAIRLCRQYDAQHRRQGWGGIGYHFCIARNGTLILLRPIGQKGAHVGGSNSRNVGVMCHGTTGDKPTEAQAETFRWLLANAHTSAMPSSHRSPVSLAGCALRGHNDWADHRWNACPGTHKQMFVTGGRSR